MGGGCGFARGGSGGGRALRRPGKFGCDRHDDTVNQQEYQAAAGEPVIGLGPELLGVGAAADTMVHGDAEA